MFHIGDPSSLKYKARDAKARKAELVLVVFFDCILFNSLYVILVDEFIVSSYNCNFSHWILFVYMISYIFMLEICVLNHIEEIRRFGD